MCVVLGRRGVCAVLGGAWCVFWSWGSVVCVLFLGGVVCVCFFLVERGVCVC